MDGEYDGQSMEQCNFAGGFLLENWFLYELNV
jgi:hypothetical protein